MLAQASAATAAASRTTALPVSVARKSRSGACRLRAQAVRPLNREPKRGMITRLAFQAGGAGLRVCDRRAWPARLR